MGDEFYPQGPANVRADLTRPSAAYKRHAYVAVAGVVLFLVGYFAAIGWFGWTAYRLFTSIPHATTGAVVVLAGAVASTFIAALMLKAVFFVRRGELERDIEATPNSHPRLFAFLYRLADEAKAPRPHRVFLSPRVNAAVYYDLSLANLIFSSKKNLEIGLGLVNALTLSELKAVLAHEFGHFAQRTMAVGRWVYIAQVIAQHLVARRDGLDRLLHRISNMDPRIAWIGWGARLIVWSIRSLIESIFGLVILAKRALTREMELQADLVAVSLTGSDALVHALYRLEAADDAMDRALAFADEETRTGKAISDLFAIQDEMLEQTRSVLADPQHGLVPPLPAEPARHRLFKAQFAQPPRMWSTHPPNNVREENAKAEYVSAALDDRSAWVLFEESGRLRAEVTSWVYARAAKKAGPARPRLETPPLRESLARLAKKFDRRFFDPSYRGVYLSRSCVRDADRASDLYGPPPSNVIAELDALYPSTISVDLERIRELTREHAMLRGLERGILETPGKTVRYRGEDHHRRALPQLIERVQRELTETRAKLAEHDKRVRTAHLAAARQLSPAWEHYLKAVAGLLHYAEHRLADLADAMGVLENALVIALADGRVSAREAGDLVVKARIVHATLLAVHREAPEVHLGSLAGPLAVDRWPTLLGALSLPAPMLENIGSWLEVIHSWVAPACNALDKLSMAALDELLRVERSVGNRVRDPREPVIPLPDAPRVPAVYATLVSGRERHRQTTLGWWERFYVADGFVPGAARFLCAGAIIAVIIVASFWVGDATVHVVNGLGRDVRVTIGTDEVLVPPHGNIDVDIAPSSHVSVRARTKDGAVIEAFEAQAPDQYGQYIYDVAQAAPLVVYEPGPDRREVLRVQRWTSTHVSHVRDVTEGMQVPSTDPDFLFSPAQLDPNAVNGEDAGLIASAHVRWDPPGTVNLEGWLVTAQSQPDFPALLAARIAAMPDEVSARRFEQELGPRDEVCARHRQRAAERSDSPAWLYLAARCIEDPATRNETMLSLAAKWPDEPWLMYAQAYALADRDQLEDASRVLARVIKMLPEARTNVAAMAARFAQSLGKPIPQSLIDLEPMLAATKDSATDAGRGDRAVLHRLRSGKLQAALDALSGHPTDSKLIVLVACSDGATAEQVKLGAVAPDGIDSDTALYAYALALRTGRDATPYRKHAVTMDERQAFDFVDQVHQAAPAQRESITPPIDFRSRALAYAAATVLIGEAAPPSWRAYAKRALFVFERPYLR